jgi:hypothetical protein
MAHQEGRQDSAGGGAASRSGENDKAEQIRQKAVQLRRRAAEVARSVADTEDQVAATLEKVAERRTGPDAERLHAKAGEARRFAAQERDLSAEYAREDDGESPA